MCSPIVYDVFLLFRIWSSLINFCIAILANELAGLILSMKHIPNLDGVVAM